MSVVVAAKNVSGIIFLGQYRLALLALNSILFMGILWSWVIIIAIFDLRLWLLVRQVLPVVCVLLWLIDIMLQALFNPISRVDCGWVRNSDSALLLFSRLIRGFSVASVLFDCWLACLQMLAVLLVNLSSWMASGCTVSARGMALAS